MKIGWREVPDLATKLVHLGRHLEPGSPVNEAVSLSSTFVAGTSRVYGRFENSNWIAFEELMGDIEGGSALSFGSGMGAISATLETLRVGSKVVVGSDIYNGTRAYLRRAAAKGRYEVVFADMSDLDTLPDLLQGASMLWVESPTNPLMGIVDIAAVSQIASNSGALLVVDNTFATPLLQNPLFLGADVVVHSATKFIAGHSDVLSGVVISNNAEFLAEASSNRALFGAVAGPMESFLTLRGARTLHLRVLAAQTNAEVLVSLLDKSELVESLLYPGLDSHPNHLVARRQMAGPGGMFSFVIRGGSKAAEVFCESVNVAINATSLGGVETLLERRASHPGEEATPPGLVRVSAGIESSRDLLDDFEMALEKVKVFCGSSG